MRACGGERDDKGGGMRATLTNCGGMHHHAGGEPAQQAVSSAYSAHTQKNTRTQLSGRGEERCHLIAVGPERVPQDLRKRIPPVLTSVFVRNDGRERLLQRSGLWHQMAHRVGASPDAERLLTCFGVA